MVKYGNQIEVIGTLKSLPNQNFAIDFYGNPTTSLQAVRQGEEYLASVEVTTDASGFASFDTMITPPNLSNLVISATATGPNGTSEFEFMYTRPVLFVPGIFGSLPDPNNSALFKQWLTQRGFDPTELVEEPLAHSYDAIIKTLETLGYVRNQTLFVANYDWRMPVAPLNANGSLASLTAEGIATDLSLGQYQSGVDYLGYWLEQAAHSFNNTYTQIPLDSVDLIAHSTGGLVARAYIQSAAYGATVPWSGTTTEIPKVNNLVMIGVPNRGAPQAFNPLNNNWILNTTYSLVFSKVLNLAYVKLKAGSTIAGPTAAQSFTWSDALDANGNFDYLKFIRLYVPTILDLMTIDPFLNLGNGQALADVNNDPNYSNNLLLYIDAGNFAQTLESKVQQITDIYGTGVSTVVSVTVDTGPIPIGEDLNGSPIYQASLLPFADYLAQVPDANQRWYLDLPQNQGANTGDGTVPVSSSDPFTGDSNVEFVPISGIEHQSLPSNMLSQSGVLQYLGFAAGYNSQISTATSSLGDQICAASWVASLAFDPVGAVLTDSQGRRLGYTPQTGPLEEIPNSIFLGDATAGFGLAFGTGPVPTQIQLSGVGGSYSVLVSGLDSSGNFFGADVSGTLASGQTQSVALTLPQPGPPALLLVDDSGTQGDDITDITNPHLTGTTVAGGTVQLLDSASNVVATTTADTSGIYSVQIPGPLAVGTYEYRLEVADSNGVVSAPSDPLTLTIVPSTITTTKSAANPSIFGQPVSFTASVAAGAPGSSTPTGSVQFGIDGSPFGSPVTLISGSATSASISTLAVASHSVTAVFIPANGSFATSTGTLTQTVTRTARRPWSAPSGIRRASGKP